MDEEICPKNPLVFDKQRYDRSMNKFNEFSVYIEKDEVEGLTLYDIYRQARAPVGSEYSTTLPVRVLNAELTCPICLGILHDTMVVMECLHRFCSQCITKCLRLGRKECPACRIHVPSRRSLRPDPNFDALISKIYPNLAEFEINEEMMIEEINRSHYVNNAFTESCRQGIENQAQNRRLRKKIPSTQTSKKLSSTTPAISKQASKKRRRRQVEPSPDSLMDFVLRRHPEEKLTPPLVREYLRTVKDFKIHHVKKFIGKKLNIPHFADFEISVVASGQGVILDDKLTLDDVANLCAIKDNEMILHFRYTRRNVEETNTISSSGDPHIAISGNSNEAMKS